MKISGIVLKHFKQYYGEQEFTFSVDDDYPVTVVHGENGAGKSSLLEAFRWVLYGKSASSTTASEDNQTLINTNAKAEGKKAEVQLVVSHENEWYRLIRTTKDGRSSFSFKVFKLDPVDGNATEVPEPVAFVANVLPEELSDYFLFAGEGISDLSENLSGEPFIDAVRKIYGFVFVEKLVDDLKQIIVAQRRKLSSIKGEDSAYTEAQARIDEYRVELEKFSDLKKKLDVEISEHNRKLDEVVRKIGSSGHAEASAIQKKLKNCEEEISRLRRLVEANHEQKRTLISRYGWSIFGTQLASEYGSVSFEENDDRYLNAPWDDYLLNRLLEEAICLCGRDICEDSPEADSIKEKLKTSQTSELKERVAATRAFVAHTKNASTEFLSDLRQIVASEAENEQQLARKESERLENEAELKSIDVVDIQSLNRARKELKEVISKKTMALGRCQSESAVILQNLQTSEAEINKHSAKTAQRRRVEAVGEAVQRVLTQTEQILEHETKTSLEEVNSKIAEFIATQPVDMSITVEPNFNLKIENRDGLMNPSQGESLMINLVYVATLISTARERVQGASKIFSSGSVAPFVIDAPFGEMDMSYSGSVIDRLVTDSNQLILFVSSSHWNSVKDQKKLNKGIGKEYVLIKHVVSEKSADGKIGKKTIRLRGKDIEQIKLGAKRNQTVPKEIYSAY